MNKTAILLRQCALAACLCLPLVDARATGVPVDGFLPQVGITLTSEFDAPGNLLFMPGARTSPAANSYYLGHGSPHYDVALLDTGAATSLITSAADAAFNVDGPYPGRTTGFRGTNIQVIGGASGFVDTLVSDPLGLYVAGLEAQYSTGAGLAMSGASMRGQINTSLLTLPPESQLPNVLGLSFASQYAIRIRNSLPQVFELNGETVRTPSIDFQPLGSAGLGISRKAQLFLLGDGPSTPFYFPDLGGIGGGGDIWDNPTQPTVVQGGHFLNVNVQNEGSGFSSQFFFDTGASVTVVSTFKALELGFDVLLDEPEFTISIVGSGGTLEDVPGFFVDQFTIPALGGSLVANNVPVIVLDVTNVSSPGNTVDGIVGMNLFHGRDIVIDANPSLGGGGPSPGLYISDPVTTQFNWTTAAATGNWATGTNWSATATPGYLAVANVRHVSGSSQEARITADAQAFEVNISGGTSGQLVTLSVASGTKLTTFTGTNIEAGGVLSLESATLDTQYVDIRAGGTLTGSGSIRTGSGVLPGQVENNGGTVAPGFGVGTLEIEGRYAGNANSTLQIELAGTTPGTLHDQLIVDGGAALNGTLQVILEGGYSPLVGSSYTILNATEGVGGQFANLLLPSSYIWDIDYLSNSVVLQVTGLSMNLAGDFNGDGIVDAADYTVWRDTQGSTGMGLVADANGDMTVDHADYAIWRSNFGSSAAAGSLANGGATIPEPGTLIVALGSIACFLAFFRRRVACQE